MRKIFLLLICMCSTTNADPNTHPAQTTVYLYGLERSGTNFMEKYLLDNFETHVDPRPKLPNRRKFNLKHPGYKHFRIYDDKSLIVHPPFKNNLIVHAIEDLDLLLNDNKHTNKYIVIYKNIFSWLSSSIRFWGKSKKELHLYSADYIAYRKKWNSLQNERVLLINYNEFIKSDQTINCPHIQKLSRFLSVPPKHTTLKTRKKVYASSPFSKKRLNYYLNKEYMNLFSKKEIADINAMLIEAGLPSE